MCDCVICLASSPQTKLAKIKGGWDNTVHYSEDHFGSRPPLIFGSVVVKDGDKTTLLVQHPIQSTSAKAIWNPRLYVISRDSCRDFVFEEVSVFFGTTLLMVLHVKDREKQTYRTLVLGFKGSVCLSYQQITEIHSMACDVCRTCSDSASSRGNEPTIPGNWA